MNPKYSQSLFAASPRMSRWKVYADLRSLEVTRNDCRDHRKFSRGTALRMSRRKFPRHDAALVPLLPRISLCRLKLQHFSTRDQTRQGRLDMYARKSNFWTDCVTLILSTTKLLARVETIGEKKVILCTVSCIPGKFGSLPSFCSLSSTIHTYSS